MNYLQNHPFAVEAFFESSIVLTFAVPKDELSHLIPACLDLDTYQDKWAFIAVAMVQTKGLRPKGFPRFMGNDFFLSGYRIFVRYKNNKGKNLRGLYILKSETDKLKMKLMGNIFTHYNYSTIDISKTTNNEITTIQSHKSSFKILIKNTNKEVNLPINSPFENWSKARRFAGPLPHTFTYNEKDKTVLIIKGIRQNWEPKPLQILEHQFGFLDSLQLDNLVLANAFEITNIPYHWEKGKLESWK